MLAQKIKVYSTHNCTKLAFKDTTGMYEVSDNDTGWGTPNTDPSAVTEAIITVQIPDVVTVHTFDVTQTVQDIVLPSAYVLNYSFMLQELTATDLGVSALPDGIYTVTYSIDGESIEVKVLIFCNTQCCVNKLLEKAIDTYLCGGNCTSNKLISEALKARALILQAQQWQFSCFNLEQADKLIKQAAKICKSNGCSCGCS